MAPPQCESSRHSPLKSGPPVKSRAKMERSSSPAEPPLTFWPQEAVKSRRQAAAAAESKRDSREHIARVTVNRAQRKRESNHLREFVPFCLRSNEGQFPGADPPKAR